MKVAVVYDSMTGTTAEAAKKMGEILEEAGHECVVQSISDADTAVVTAADLICIGSWVKGLFIIRQHPTDGIIWFIDQMGDLTGKKAVVFCTYKLAVGSTLRKMARPLSGKGAQVIGQFKYRGPEPDSKFESFVTSLT